MLYHYLDEEKVTPYELLPWGNYCSNDEIDRKKYVQGC